MRPVRAGEKILLHLVQPEDHHHLQSFLDEWRPRVLNYDYYVYLVPPPDGENQTGGCGFEKLRHTRRFRVLGLGDPPAKSAYQEVLARPIRISYVPFNPMAYEAKASGRLDGFDIDLWRLIARHQGARVEFVRARFLGDMPPLVSWRKYCSYYAHRLLG